MEIAAYLLVPKLIPQPTWGGQYIATYKGLQDSPIGKLAIGQSYELATDSMLATVPRASQLPLEIANASDGTTQEVIGDRSNMFSLQSLIDQDPEKVLGKAVVASHGHQMQVLIKFTQAKGNSFQVHVMPGSPVGAWKPKPESWYFFEPGKVTLGLKRPIDLAGYQAACVAIDQKAKELSKAVAGSTLSGEQAKHELSSCIAQHSPFAFVNEFVVPKDTLVDLSEGGIHHSWEEGEEIPQGNIVYEVQLNVMDKDCTLRSFDKGKIGDDGALRPIHIEEYFQALNTDDQKNDPASYMSTMHLRSDGGVNTAKLFDTLHYKSRLLSFAGEYRGVYTTTNEQESFHHLFIKEGDVNVVVGNKSLYATKGSSVFLPANTGEYMLQATVSAQVITTWM